LEKKKKQKNKEKNTSRGKTKVDSIILQSCSAKTFCTACANIFFAQPVRKNSCLRPTLSISMKEERVMLSRFSIWNWIENSLNSWSIHGMETYMGRASLDMSLTFMRIPISVSLCTFSLMSNTGRMALSQQQQQQLTEDWR